MTVQFCNNHCLKTIQSGLQSLTHKLKGLDGRGHILGYIDLLKKEELHIKIQENTQM